MTMHAKLKWTTATEVSQFTQVVNSYCILCMTECQNDQQLTTQEAQDSYTYKSTAVKKATEAISSTMN